LLGKTRAIFQILKREHQAITDEVEAHSYGRAREMWRSAIDTGNIDFIKEHKNKDSFQAHMITLKNAYRRKAEQYFDDNLKQHLVILQERLNETLDKEITKQEDADKKACEALSIPFEPSAPARALARKKQIINNSSFSKTGSPTQLIKTITDHEDFLK
jgi:hypothetical protein